MTYVDGLLGLSRVEVIFPGGYPKLRNGRGDASPDVSLGGGAVNDLHLKRCWPELRRLFARAFASSYHFAIASVDETGAPHVTPIGSVLLGEPGQLVYFEEFPTALPCNIQRNPSLL